MYGIDADARLWKPLVEWFLLSSLIVGFKIISSLNFGGIGVDIVIFSRAECFSCDLFLVVSR